MRKLTISLFVFAFILLLMIIARPGRLIASIAGDCTGSDIQVDFADASWCNNSTLSSGLESLLAGVGAHVGSAYADTVLTPLLTPLPDAFQSLLDQVPVQVGFDFSQSNRHMRLTPLPAAFQSLLDLVPVQVGFNFSQSYRHMSLTYPGTLVNDQTSPQLVGSITIVPNTDNTEVAIQWTTNEFADSTVQYGTSPGIYTETASNSQYVKSHALTLTGLTAGTTYYYQVRSADLGGNTWQSSEQSFEFITEMFVYLPVVTK